MRFPLILTLVFLGDVLVAAGMFWAQPLVFGLGLATMIVGIVTLITTEEA